MNQYLGRGVMLLPSTDTEAVPVFLSVFPQRASETCALTALSQNVSLYESVQQVPTDDKMYF